MHTHARPATLGLTHASVWDERPNRHGERRTQCRAWASRQAIDDHDPTCPTCARAIAADDDLEIDPVDGMLTSRSARMESDTLPAPSDLFSGPLAIEFEDPAHELSPSAAIDVVAQQVRELTYEPIAPPAQTPSASGVLTDIVETLEQDAGAGALASETTDIVVRANAFAVSIDDPSTIAAGKAIFTALFEMEKAVHGHYDPHCDRAYKAWKALTDERGGHLKEIERARKDLGERIATVEAQIRNREAAEQREREKAARDKQRDDALREAKEVLKTGDVAGAAQVIAEAKSMPVSVAPRPSVVAPSATTSTRKRWVAVIDDWSQLRADIGAGKYPEFDDKLQALVLGELNGMATRLNKSLDQKYPGAHAEQKAGLAGR